MVAGLLHTARNKAKDEDVQRRGRDGTHFFQLKKETISCFFITFLYYLVGLPHSRYIPTPCDVSPVTPVPAIKGQYFSIFNTRQIIAQMRNVYTFKLGKVQMRCSSVGGVGEDSPKDDMTGAVEGELKRIKNDNTDVV